MTRMASTWLAILAVGLGVAYSVSAQEAILNGKQVTESALIDALTIDSPSAHETGKERGFRPASNPALRRPAPAGPGKASLLMTFAVDSAELSPETMSMLDTVAKALQSDQLAGFSFRIEGHADPRGVAERNLALSEQRAAAVVSYLVARHGILPERLTSVGKGSTELLDPQRPDAAVNRRVTIVTVRG